MSDATKTVSSEDVMAYVDGELPPARAATVARAIADDPDLQRDMDDYLASSAALRHAFDDALSEPVPAHLRRQVLGENDTVVPIGRRQTERPVWIQALAACVVLGFGLVIGLTLRPDSGDTSTSMIAGAIVDGHPLDKALTTASSGQRLASGSEEIHVVQTFIVANGNACREFEVTRADRGVTGIACRDSGGWQVSVIVDGATDVRDGFVPASGVAAAAIDEAVRKLGAGDGLGREAEKCLLVNDWNSEHCSAN